MAMQTTIPIILIIIIVAILIELIKHLFNF